MAILQPLPLGMGGLDFMDCGELEELDLGFNSCNTSGESGTGGGGSSALASAATAVEIDMAELDSRANCLTATLEDQLDSHLTSQLLDDDLNLASVFLDDSSSYEPTHTPAFKFEEQGEGLCSTAAADAKLEALAAALPAPLKRSSVAASPADICAVLVRAEQSGRHVERRANVEERRAKRARSPSCSSDEEEDCATPAAAEPAPAPAAAAAAAAGDAEATDEDREKVARTTKNREHARQSRTRKRAVMRLLEDRLLKLRSENLGLRQLVLSCMPDQADALLNGSPTAGAAPPPSPVKPAGRKKPRGAAPKRGPSASSAGALPIPQNIPQNASGTAPLRAGVPSALALMEQDWKVVESLRASQRCWALTDASRPGNPIVFASPGFLSRTGYSAEQALGAPLQDRIAGAGTDSAALAILANNMAAARDTSLCLLCRRADDTPYWGQLFVGALRDRAGHVANMVACLSEVATLPPSEFRRRLHRVPLPQELLDTPTAAATAAPAAASRPAPLAESSAAATAAAAARSVQRHYDHTASVPAAAPRPSSRVTLPVLRRGAGAELSSADGGGGAGGTCASVAGGGGGGSPAHALPKVVDPLRRTRSAARVALIC